MPTLTNRTRVLVLAGVTALLAGCFGGGGGDSPPVTTTAPPGNVLPGSATASVASLIAYLQSLIAGTDETSDPVLLGDAVLPVTETEGAQNLP
jgi:hypothetical protein